MAGLFGGGDRPAPRPAPRMPDEEGPSILDARRRERERIMSRAGRSSTILTTPETRPISDSYASRTLGAA